MKFPPCAPSRQSTLNPPPTPTPSEHKSTALVHWSGCSMDVAQPVSFVGHSLTPQGPLSCSCLHHFHKKTSSHPHILYLANTGILPHSSVPVLCCHLLSSTGASSVNPSPGQLFIDSVFSSSLVWSQTPQPGKSYVHGCLNHSWAAGWTLHLASSWQTHTSSYSCQHFMENGFPQIKVLHTFSPHIQFWSNKSSW